MNTVCIQCKFYEYSVHTSQVLWIQCAYNVSFMNTVCILQCASKFYEYSFMNTVCIQCKFYEYSVHTM